MTPEELARQLHEDAERLYWRSVDHRMRAEWCDRNGITGGDGYRAQAWMLFQQSVDLHARADEVLAKGD